MLLENELTQVNLADHDGNTPLHLAVREKINKTILDCLLHCDQIAINAQNLQGDTPLHLILSSTNSFLHIKNLLNHPNILLLPNKYGNTPLHIAADQGKLCDLHLNSSQLSRVNPNLQNKAGETLLHITVRNGFPSDVNYLLNQFKCNKKLDLNLKDNDGKTALQLVQEIREANFSPKKRANFDYILTFLTKYYTSPVI